MIGADIQQILPALHLSFASKIEYAYRYPVVCWGLSPEISRDISATDHTPTRSIIDRHGFLLTDSVSKMMPRLLFVVASLLLEAGYSDLPLYP